MASNPPFSLQPVVTALPDSRTSQMSNFVDSMLTWPILDPTKKRGEKKHRAPPGYPCLLVGGWQQAGRVAHYPKTPQRWGPTPRAVGFSCGVVGENRPSLVLLGGVSVASSIGGALGCTLQPSRPPGPHRIASGRSVHPCRHVLPISAGPRLGREGGRDCLPNQPCVV